MLAKMKEQIKKIEDIRYLVHYLCERVFTAAKLICTIYIYIKVGSFDM